MLALVDIRTWLGHLGSDPDQEYTCIKYGVGILNFFSILALMASAVGLTEIELTALSVLGLY